MPQAKASQVLTGTVVLVQRLRTGPEVDPDQADFLVKVFAPEAPQPVFIDRRFNLVVLHKEELVNTIQLFNRAGISVLLP